MKYSPIKIEIAKEKGTEIATARKVVISVPARNGTTPKVFDTGFHVLL